MRELSLILIPFAAAVLAMSWRDASSRPWLLPVAGVCHSGLALWLLASPPETVEGRWFGFDPVAQAVLPAVSVLFLVCAMYAVAYLRFRQERQNRSFIAALLALLALMSLSLQAQHLGLLWIAVEGATLATIPLLHFNGTARAFEATWKYLLVGGTGVALSLLGSFFLGYASLHGGASGDMTFPALVAQGPALSRPWVMAAWLFLLVGYGTKMGLAPMHTWKPDAYGEAPGIVGALLAGGMTTVGFVALLRVKQVIQAAGVGDIAGRTLMVMALFSMVVAALFLLGTPDFKRMLAYSSVEHMGILTFGAALGGAGLWAAFFHVWNNTLTKGALFLSAGNLRRAAAGRTVEEVRGMNWVTPFSSRLFIIALFAITACPPFGPFFSELGIVQAGLSAARYGGVAVFLGCLLLAFLGMTRLVFAITDGRPRAAARTPGLRLRETAGVTVPPLLLLAGALLLGLATPGLLMETWTRAVEALLPLAP